MEASLAVAALAARIALAASGAGLALAEGRTDVATPYNSLDGIEEGAALRELGLSAYAGSFLHAPPLLNALLGHVVGRRPAVEVLLFVAADAASALLLYRMAQACTRRKCLESPAADDAARPASPAACALLFLWNPCAIASCVGRCWSALETAAVLAALAAALEQRTALSALALVCAAYLSLYPTVMAVPVALLLAERAPAAAAGAHTAEWVSNTYRFMLHVDDLSPNMGLWWYFFSEIFDHFRAFFLFVFHAQSALLLLPLTIRLHRKPLVLAVIACMLVALFKSYPSVGDLALCAALLPVVRNELLRVRVAFVVVCALALAASLNPLLWRLWVQQYTGNANFALATTIVHSLALTAGVVNIASGACD